MKRYLRISNIITWATLGTIAGFTASVASKVNYHAVNILDYCESQVSLWNRS